MTKTIHLHGIQYYDHPIHVFAVNYYGFIKNNIKIKKV